jgi:hypothetical protein
LQLKYVKSWHTDTHSVQLLRYFVKRMIRKLKGIIFG